MAQLSTLEWIRILNTTDLVAWLLQRIRPGAVEDDLLLELIVLCGTIAMEKQCAELLFDKGITQNLIELLGGLCILHAFAFKLRSFLVKQEDDEIVLQIIYVFYQMMLDDELRAKLVTNTNVPAYLIDLMHDKNPQIRRMCDNTLQAISVKV